MDYARNILNSVSYFIVAGKDNNDESCIYLVSYKGEVEDRKVDMIIVPPSDLSIQTCNIIYVKNIKLSKKNFMKRTIKDVSDKSAVVSPTETVDLTVYCRKLVCNP